MSEFMRKTEKEYKSNQRNYPINWRNEEIKQKKNLTKNYTYSFLQKHVNNYKNP